VGELNDNPLFANYNPDFLRIDAEEFINFMCVKHNFNFDTMMSALNGISYYQTIYGITKENMRVINPSSKDVLMRLEFIDSDDDLKEIEVWSCDHAMSSKHGDHFKIPQADNPNDTPVSSVCHASSNHSTHNSNDLSMSNHSTHNSNDLSMSNNSTRNSNDLLINSPYHTKNNFKREIPRINHKRNQYANHPRFYIKDYPEHASRNINNLFIPMKKDRVSYQIKI